MNAFVLQHADFEGPAAIVTWLSKNNFHIRYINLYVQHRFPDIKEVDWLVVMGGPMSVNDEKDFPWLKEEKEFIRNCIEAGKKVVGICLGSQLIANSLGYRVYPNTKKEIGWFPIRKVESKSHLAHLIPEEITVFHWHGETFDLPAGAHLVASSEACKNQIFTLNTNVLALQCHPEMTLESISEIITGAEDELKLAEYVQDAGTIKTKASEFATPGNKLLFALLDEFKKQ